MFFFFFFFFGIHLFNVGQKLVYTDGIHYTEQACTRSTSTVLYKRWPRTRQRVQNLTDTQGKTSTPTAPHIQILSGPSTTCRTTSAQLNGGLPSSRGEDCDIRLTEGLITHKRVDAAHQQLARGQGGRGAGEFQKGR